MPAPSLAALLNFEPQLTHAARQVLAAGGFPDARQRGLNAVLPDAHTVVTVDVGAATGRLGLRPEGTTEHAQFTATLSVAVAVLRKDNEPAADGSGTLLDTRCAQIRALFLNHPNQLDGYVPHLHVNAIQPMAAQYEIDSGTEADMRILSWELTFTIPDEAWPSV